MPIALLFAKPGDVTHHHRSLDQPGARQDRAARLRRLAVPVLELTLQLRRQRPEGTTVSAFIDNNTYAMTTQDGDHAGGRSYEKDSQTYRVKEQHGAGELAGGIR